MSGFLPDSLITSTHDASKANSLSRSLHPTLSPLALPLFLSLASAPSLIFIPSPLALTNLSVLFYLPEGECFWITGLINKVNTDRQPLTQHCADRGEKQRRGWGLSVCEGKLCTYTYIHTYVCVCVCVYAYRPYTLCNFGLSQMKVDEFWGKNPKWCSEITMGEVYSDG